MSERGRVGSVARALGFAGLLPQAAAVGLVLLARRGESGVGGILALAGYGLAIAYGGLILSFLGGIWWGYAMRRSEGQASLALLAVAPSLIALASTVIAISGLPGRASPWSAVVLGSAIMLTLLVDRHLVATNEVPSGWMSLRIPLSLGLGSLTILTGALLGG